MFFPFADAFDSLPLHYTQRAGAKGFPISSNPNFTYFAVYTLISKILVDDQFLFVIMTFLYYIKCKKTLQCDIGIT